jgi:hypothetical protein
MLRPDHDPTSSYVVWYGKAGARTNAAAEWQFLTTVVGSEAALRACSACRERGWAAQAVRIDEATIALSGPPLPQEGDPA